jgi:hypothetical protein
MQEVGSDAGQIVDDLAPISRLEGDIFYRGYWILDKYVRHLAWDLAGRRTVCRAFSRY